MRKRTLALLLGLILAFGLAACGSTAETTEETTAEETTADESTEATEAEEQTLTDEEIAQMFTDPDKFKGRKVSLSGNVFTTPEKDGSNVYYQIFTDPENSENMVVVVTDGSEGSVGFNDFVRFTGVVAGTIKGENAFGGAVTAPQISTTEMEKVDPVEVLAPAHATYEPGVSASQANVTMTVDKVEFADKETRVHVSVVNEGSATVDLYGGSMAVVIQNGKQIEGEYNYSMYADYPEIAASLRAGASTDGILLFPALEEAPFQLILTGLDNNSFEEFELVADLDISQ